MNFDADRGPLKGALVYLSNFPERFIAQGGNSIGFFDRLKLGDPAQSIVSGPPNSLMLGMTWAIAQLWAV